MFYSIITLLTCLISISRTQVLPSSSNYFVISTIPTDPSITTIGYLSSTRTTIYDPFENQNVVYAISPNGTLISYSSNDSGNPQELGIIGTRYGVPNVLLATISTIEAAECDLINTTWSIVEDANGFQSLQWQNPEFPGNGKAVHFCVTDNGDIGGMVYAVFTDPPAVNCTIVTLELGN